MALTMMWRLIAHRICPLLITHTYRTIFVYGKTLDELPPYNNNLLCILCHHHIHYSRVTFVYVFMLHYVLWCTRVTTSFRCISICIYITYMMLEKFMIIRYVRCIFIFQFSSLVWIYGWVCTSTTYI